jgi:Na+/phosphate symporter
MNTNEIKLNEIQKTLESCLRGLPDQFALDEVKSNLRRTLESIKKVQVKRHRRRLTEQENQRSKMAFASYEDAKKALDILEKMMQDEQKNLEDLTKPKPQNTITDYNDDGMLLG